MCREQERACESGKVAIDQYFLFERVLRYFTFHLIFSITSCSVNFAIFVVGVLVLSIPHLDITSFATTASGWLQETNDEFNYKQDNIAFAAYQNSINQAETLDLASTFETRPKSTPSYSNNTKERHPFATQLQATRATTPTTMSPKPRTIVAALSVLVRKTPPLHQSPNHQTTNTPTLNHSTSYPSPP